MQPRGGYRAGADSVMLAAAVPARSGEAVLELGCGTGAALLCLGARVPDLRLTGVELQPGYADLARRNAALNHIPAEVVEADLRALPPDLKRPFDHVLFNPPYYDRRHSVPVSDPGRETAFGGETVLADWIDAAARRLRRRGTATLILRIERVPEALVAMEGRLGSLALLPLASRGGRPPERAILRGVKLGRAAFRLHPPLVLHEGARHEGDREDYCAFVKDILRNGRELPI
ncbi:tRNA1(Val) (adenine(37)-N6)-methyltransferase [Pseudoroseicyclus aestuarii]|nr:methyltransferase domain-containing protein [Pseudoroseicyclus aestuarii]